MDKAEFTRRATACAAQLYRVSWCILRNHADCEDAVQEALLRAWRKIHTLRSKEYFETWLTRILINECRGMLRKRTDTEELQENIVSAQEMPESSLHTAMRQMDRRYSLPLILKHVSGYTNDEISRILKIPVTTVKWRLREGRRKLQALLAADA